jgi:D-sedoheptulose 7-phosphate isomerase
MDAASGGTTSPSRLYFDRLADVIDTLDCAEMDAAIELVRAAWLDGRQIITFGNGGSAMTALHFITDWNKSVFAASGRPFRGRSLLDNMGLITALGNDVDYDSVFEHQLRQIAVPGDLVIAISGSGNSPNVIRAVDYANAIGCQTLGLCGFDGGKLKTIAQHRIWIEAHNMQICEDLHMVFGHIAMQILCGMLKSVPEATPEQQSTRQISSLRRKARHMRRAAVGE